jgi:hypothetical protein
MDRGGDLKITITGVNNATKVFDAVIDSAEKIGPALDDATGSAKKLKPAADEAVRAIDPLDDRFKETGRAAEEASTSIDQSARSLGDYRRSAQDTVAGLAILGTAFTMYAGQARDHEVAIMALNRTYGEAAQSYIDLANTIQGSTTFSNDQAIEAANIMGTLKRNYELTDGQIQQLIVTSADLAAVNGTTLADAAQRVAAAIRGEAESAEMLGLTMNQAAIDQDNLTLSMSNAEAGAFRFNALMEQSEFAIGAAGDAADTTTGRVQQLANDTQDAVLAFVNFTGPVGEVAAGLGSFGLQAGIAAGGIAQLGKGLMGLKSAGAFTSLIALAPALIGPVGIIAGLGLATYGAIELYGALTDVEEVSSSSQMAVDALAASYTTLGQSAADAATLTAADTLFTGITAGLDEATNDLAGFQSLWNEFGDEFQAWQAGGNVSPMILPQMIQMTEYINEFGASAEEAGYKISNMQYDLAAIISSGNVDAIRDATAAWSEFQASDQLAGDWKILHDTLNDINHEVQGWGDSTDVATAGNANLAASMDDVATAATGVTTATQAQTTALTSNTTATQEQARSADILTDALIAQEVAAAQLLKTQTLAADREIERQRANLWSGAEPMAPDVVGITDPRTLRAFSMGQLEINTALIEGAAAAGAAWKSVREYVYAVDAGSKVLALASDYADTYAKSIEYGTRSSETSLAVIAELAEEYGQLADSVRESAADMNPASVLDSTFGGVVGTAQNFARLSESIWDWSNSLTEGNKATSTLNDLNQKGLISDKTYRDGLEANHRIMLANNSVQEDALRIQAKQLPLMAQLAEEHAAYVDTIADMPAEQQLVSLGFLDQAKTAQALELAQLAAASSSEAMQASTANMVLEIANADPQLKAMLLSMGLLTEPDGVLSVNFGDVDSANVAIENLTDAVTLFAGVIGEAFGIDVKMTDNDVEGRLSRVLALLNAMDGRSVTTYVTTVGIDGGSLAAAGRAALHGGVIDGYAGGGIVIEAAEAGPELLRYPGGPNVLAVNHDYYSVPRGTSVLPAPATRDLTDRAQGGGNGPTYYGPVFQTVTLDRSRFAQRSHDLARSRNGRR